MTVQGPKLVEVLERELGPGGPPVAGRAPGRVNLIGEHTDYNDGFVLPMAIGFGVEMVGRRRQDGQVRVHAADLSETSTFQVGGAIARDPAHPWSDYVRGVVWSLEEAGLRVEGMDLAFSGDLPQGAGLSSSAALEVSTALVAQALSGFEAERPRLARLCQHAENDFVGMKCGIMDQFISLMGEPGHALLLDCRSLAHQLVPLTLDDHAIAICHSGVKHSLVASAYNQRRAECTAGVAAMAARSPGVRALRDATLEQLEAVRAQVSDPVYRRCRHIITENARVLESAEAMRRGDLAAFGRLMNASHDSQRDDFEVSCAEVDLLVDLARSVPGVLGARITGGGFGGCTVNLVERRSVEDFKAKVLDVYQRRTGITPRLFLSTPGAGARISSQSERVS
ncbi:MAG: galactokinase [Anaeromyxobacter sp.]